MFFKWIEWLESVWYSFCLHYEKYWLIRCVFEFVSIKKGNHFKKKLKLSSYLFSHRIIPNTIGISPAEHMLKLTQKTRSDLLKPFGNSNNVPRLKNVFTLNEWVYFKNQQIKLWQKDYIVKTFSFFTNFVQTEFVHALMLIRMLIKKLIIRSQMIMLVQRLYIRTAKMTKNIIYCEMSLNSN